ncbi:phage tail sheath protein [Methylobacterium radiotolerans]|uniref:phage tail sheath family protein n=1 Tax=Methylobacterium radiotolerans TaxID=31998 RepID=UPI001F2E3343|nr:phage tail sheath family protein [Methylobacterium radiotolerans]UIY44152.1 phage tail sheath family protein [Methylobacterium radiotolerans]
MSATTDFVGVRVFSDLGDTTVSIDTRDSTVIGMCLPCPNMATADKATWPDDGEPVTVSTDDAETIAKLGPGLAQDAIAQIAAEGIITDIAFVRAPDVADLETQVGKIVGSANSKSGIWGLLEAKDTLKLEPGCIIAPGYDSQRLGSATNPVAQVIDTLCLRIIDCIGIVNTPATSREDAVTYAADFKLSRNMIAMYPNGRYYLNGQEVVRPLSPSVAAAMVRRDKQVGNPYKAFWNKPLVGVRGPSQRVTYRDGDTSSDGNFLVQNGVGTIIEGNLLWAPYTTATDPTTVGYRSIKRIRTRRAVEKAMLRPLRAYMSEDMGGHLVTLIGQTLDDFCGDLKSLNAIIDYLLVWSKGLNPASLLRGGGLRLKLDFEETPDLTDLQIYDYPYPEAFDVLAAAIASQISSLNNANFVATA